MKIYAYMVSEYALNKEHLKEEVQSLSTVDS